MGIEPTSEAWEACHLTQKTLELAAFLRFSEVLNWKIMENEIGCEGLQRSEFGDPAAGPPTSWSRNSSESNQATVLASVSIFATLSFRQM
jgi:hypothetical protein